MPQQYVMVLVCSRPHRSPPPGTVASIQTRGKKIGRIGPWALLRIPADAPGEPAYKEVIVPMRFSTNLALVVRRSGIWVRVSNDPDENGLTIDGRLA